VKPDNWALCSSIVDGETVPASDLQLIDFGRAVDLKSHQVDGRHVMETKFTGKATTNDMMCVAMREGLPWSFDIDTFGICASVHILLFGTHIEIKKDKGRWMPKERVRRYHNQIWHEFFYMLLNLKDGVALGSHPQSLRRLRKQFELHLEEKKVKLANELKNQARFLPPTPPRAY
jgi:checkpoint serine/threonine-protein kinase